MLGIVLGLRLYLHLVKVQHVYPGGYLVHHLFWGVLILIPATFLLAFDPGKKAAIFCRMLLGIGSGMVLDEVVYLVVTKGGDDDYVSRISLVGSIVFLSLAVILLLILYKLKRERFNKL